MTNRKKGLIFFAFGWLLGGVLTVGIKVFGWPIELVVVVPIVGSLAFLAIFESLTDGVLARWRRRWIRNRRPVGAR